ncbi:hypothetical protein BX600DRAFT_506213 [Xylariales sp. PMI_506]|nr:hypothetical protein BX600DRAFT_506213 [Xylariales sp. PMI_506]
MSAPYTFEKPSVTLDPGIYGFLEQFYRISDTPGDHDVYADQFTADATLIMASKTSQGTAGSYHPFLARSRQKLPGNISRTFTDAYHRPLDIKAFRESMWTHVAERKHTVHKVFAISPQLSEVMLYGKVEYKMKTGANSAKDWAGRAILQKSEGDGKWRFTFYQVYLDMAN